MKKNILISSITFAAIIVLAFVLRFAGSTPQEDFIITGENYSGNTSSAITISNGDKVIATIPALKNETVKEIKIEPFDVGAGGFVISYVDKSGKKHDDIHIDAEQGTSTMNSQIYLTINEVKDDGTMSIDYRTK
ncbi:hypothetical protein PGRAN_01940 [Listeria grandensis FSL F6-0971]|uniref:Uncharacterized protein n=1 Tax=Listeria grandensis FSL F6-0971 TaxID=1265819 RepID=W7BWB8_9LIST|nr:hypothetical protein [Listeria grandensis]EUJ24623.1 hypothetical protein PGRAN_01940 [Listeria grandensis FSL F6-0971]